MSVAIALEQVRKGYRLGDTRIDALKGIDLTVEEGTMVALAGPSGSGKSTLLNLCGLVDRPDAGRIALRGVDVADRAAGDLTQLRREAIGFVFQGFNLVPVMSACENVEYPLLLLGVAARERRRRVAEILEQVGLAPFARHLPDRLSGGQRQRVAIARALVKRPQLVVADEPTANLDTTTATQVIELMHGLGRALGTTFLIATHDERMAVRCDRAVHLVDGVLQ